VKPFDIFSAGELHNGSNISLWAANIFFIIIGFGTYFSSIPILASGLLYKRVKMEKKEEI
jgi:hypothetical protein